jgi:hypothetical protein
MTASPPRSDWNTHILKGVFLRFIVHENRNAHG